MTMIELRTWKQKSDLLDSDIENLINYHSDNFSKGIILERFKKILESKK